MKPYRGELYSDRGRSWRWRVRASNGRLICTSGESFASKSNALKALRGMLAAIRERNIVVAN